MGKEATRETLWTKMMHLYYLVAIPSHMASACFFISAKITDVLTKSLQKLGGFPRHTFLITSWNLV